MNEAVQKFLEEKETKRKLEEERAYTEEKNKILIKLGLCDKVYSPDNTCNDEYNLAEYNQYTTKYFKFVPYEVDEEEYEKVKAYYYSDIKSKEKRNSGKNGVASLLRAIAIIILVIGFIAGIVFATDEKGILLFISWVVAFVIGIEFFGFAEIIKLLTQIRDK